MMIRILHYENREEWKTILSDIGANDIYFSPEYLKANETILKGDGECFVYKDKHCFVLYPYIKRPIEDSDFSDITSPYGYGGYVKSPTHSTADSFHVAFHRYCREAGIVSEFIRFHPLYFNHSYMHHKLLQINFHQPVVIINYTQNNFEFRQIIKREAWKKIRKAEKKQINVIEDVHWEYYQDFIKLYKENMDVKQASDFYYFENAFFEALKTFLSDRSLLLIALHEGRMIGGLLIIFGNSFVYNFLSCSDYQYPNLGTNDLLQFKALDWGYKKGFKIYMLGGGLEGEDPIFHFKAKFSSQRKDFFLGRRIHLPEAYTKLCGKEIKQKNIKPEELLSGSWFPYYRRKY